MEKIFLSFEGVDAFTRFSIKQLMSSFYRSVNIIQCKNIDTINDGLVIFFRDSLSSQFTCFHPKNIENVCIIYIIRDGHDFYMKNSFSLKDDINKIKKVIFNSIYCIKKPYICQSCNLVIDLSKKDIEWICCRTFEIKSGILLNFHSGIKTSKLESLRKRRVMKKIGINSNAYLVKYLPKLYDSISSFYHITKYRKQKI